MASVLCTGNVESRKYFAMEHAGGKADMWCGRGVNGRCQRADRAGGIHVGLIFCNFSIKRKVKDYNLFKGLSLATKHDVHFLNSTLKQRGSIFTIISEPSCILSTKKKQMAGTICSGGMYWIRTNDLCRVEAAL